MELSNSKKEWQTLPEFIQHPTPEYYLTQPYKVVDFETTNYDKGDARNSANSLLLGVVRGGGRSTLVSSTFDTAFTDLLAGNILVAHNAKFELHWLKRLGYPIERLLVFDTLLAEKVLAGNRSWPLDLDSVSKKYGGTQKNILIKRMMKAGVNPAEMPEKELGDYCEEDCRNTEIIFKAQLEELKRLNLLQIVYTRCLLLPVLVDIECRGMQLDEQRVAEEYNGTKRQYDRCLDTLAGYLNGANPNSPKQLAALLYDVYGFEEVKDGYGRPARTATGSRKTDKPTLARLRARTPAQKGFLGAIKEQAKLDTKLNNYLEKFRKSCGEAEGKLLGELNQINPRTHRLSSTGGKFRVQLQNMDRGLKRLFRAEQPGWLVFEADQAQLEFRVAAELTGDIQAKKDIDEHVDVHTVTQQFLESKGQKQSRQDSKPMTFRPVYGGESGTDAERAYCKFFNLKYSEMYRVQTSWEMEVFKNKVLVLPYGMRFYWPDIKMRKEGRTTEHTSIFNYPVQSFATAEIVPIGVIYAWHLFRAYELEAYFVNTVHDSIIGECPPDEKEIVEKLVNLGMVSCVRWYLRRVYGRNFSVPLEIETNFYKYWGDKEAK